MTTFYALRQVFIAVYLSFAIPAPLATPRNGSMSVIGMFRQLPNIGGKE